MKKKYVLLNVAAYASISSLVAVAAHLFNVFFLSPSTMISPTDAFFIEGIFSLLSGFLLLLGRGGINLWSKKAAILASAAEAISGEETVGPREVMRRDAWKPKGFVRTGLVLVITGVLMLAVYFLTL